MRGGGFLPQAQVWPGASYAALCSHHRSQLRTSYPGARISTQVAIPRGF